MFCIKPEFGILTACLVSNKTVIMTDVVKLGRFPTLVLMSLLLAD